MYKPFLTYTLRSDNARTVLNIQEWDRYVGALQKKNNTVWGISFVNKDTSPGSGRDIIVKENILGVGEVYEILPPTPGGTVDIKGIDIRWPSGDAILQIVLHRITDLRYIQIPIDEG
jgi:hypothetical protein